MENDKKQAKLTKGDLMEAGIIAKVPPHDQELEQAVLGALMLERDSHMEVADLISAGTFYSDRHAYIYEAIARLSGRAEPCDILTVTSELRAMGRLEYVGGPYFIAQLTSRVNQASNILYHTRLLQQYQIKRQMIDNCNASLRLAYSDSSDALEILDVHTQAIYDIEQGHFKKGFQSMTALLGISFNEIIETTKLGGGLTGTPSGFSALDRLTAGWQRSNLIVLAARPGMGKTAFVLSAVRNAAIDFNKAVAVFSLEMSATDLMKRLISSETETDGEAIRSGRLSKPEISAMMNRTERLAKAPIYIDDTPSLSILELRAKCRRLKAQQDIQLIVIDYLQLMSGGEGKKMINREQEISYISRSLKALAKELDVPVIALSQLSRAVEGRSDKRPSLSDLRESGAIEQDADMVCFLYRPEYYGIKEDENGLPINGLAEFIIAKQRNGALGTANLRFIGQYTKFTEWQESAYIPQGRGAGPGAVVLQDNSVREVPF